jgi:hypothetical protein
MVVFHYYLKALPHLLEGGGEILGHFGFAHVDSLRHRFDNSASRAARAR